MICGLTVPEATNCIGNPLIVNAEPPNVRRLRRKGSMMFWDVVSVLDDVLKTSSVAAELVGLVLPAQLVVNTSLAFQFALLAFPVQPNVAAPANGLIATRIDP